MGSVYYNGLHWNVVGPADSPRPQYTAGQQFSAAMVLASGNSTFGGSSTGCNGWEEICSWIRANTSRTGEIVLRLYWKSGYTLAGDPGPTLGQKFSSEIVQPAIDQFGIRNFQVLNELNLEYEPSKARSSLKNDMYNIAW